MGKIIITINRESGSGGRKIAFRLGFQVGIVNRAESFYGFQGGVVNVIRETEFAFLPIINVGFDLWTDPKF